MMEAPSHEQAVLGGGCFWCLEAAFLKFRGVETVVSGYAGGSQPDPTYEEVSAGKTGHAEVVKIDFDPRVISYATLLRIFFTLHDPTTLNRQGNDIGTQYRSLILFTSEIQREVAKNVITELESAQVFAGPVVTETKPLEVFYSAEEYHQNYYTQHPEQAYCQAIISPKLVALRASFRDLLK